jgi:hypothetical protein
MTKEAKMKTYGVSITAGGVSYNFHVDSIKKVRELFTGSRYITKFAVTEQTHEFTTFTSREMDDVEVQDIIWGRAA